MKNKAMKNSITAETAAKASYYRLPTESTPELLEMHLQYNRGTVLVFGDYVLADGYFYNPNMKEYYGALYAFTTEDHTIEGKIELIAVSEDCFEDAGHAIAWAMNKANAR